MKVLLFLIPLLLLVGWINLYDRRMMNRGRRSPFNENTLNVPGQSVRKAQWKKIGDFLFYTFGVASVPFFFGVGATDSLLTNLLLAAMGLILVGFCFYKAVQVYRDLTHLILGVDAEMSSGQELNLLMRDGAWVFHDIPYVYGNIDHVIISTGGVFAVETKGISKPTDEGRSGVENATLKVAEGTLLLPHARTRKPIEQARCHAKWLHQEIERHVGIAVPVQPVVAIPGWMIEGGLDGDCLVINPRRGNALRARVIQNKMAPEVASRIAARIEDLARAVAPKSREFDPKKGVGL